MIFNRQNSGNYVSVGFTIVELLIVVVVIAILAAISIVAYNGVTQRANDSAAQSALSTAQKKIGAYFVENAETYPDYIGDTGIPTNSNITYQYSANNLTTPKGYCVSASSNNSRFRAAYQFVPLGTSDAPMNTPSSESGVCPGHLTPGLTITNYVPNSGVGVSTAGYSGPNSTTFTRDTTKGAEDSDSSVLVTMPQNAHSTVGLMFYAVPNVATVFTAGMTYTASAWVWVPSGTVDVRISIQGLGKTSVGNLPQRITSEKDKWVRVYDTFVANSTGTMNFYILNNVATPTAGTQFWADSFMINQSNIPAKYANGNTPGWTWSGTSGLSTSSGPASL